MLREAELEPTESMENPAACPRSKAAEKRGAENVFAKALNEDLTESVPTGEKIIAGMFSQDYPDLLEEILAPV